MSKKALADGAEAFAQAYLSEASEDFQRLMRAPGKPKLHPVFLEAMEKGFVRAVGTFGEMPAVAASIPAAGKAAAEAVEEAIDDAGRAAGGVSRSIARALAGGLLVGVIDAVVDGLLDEARRDANRAKLEAALGIAVAAVAGTFVEFWAVPKAIPDTDLENRKRKRTGEKRYRRHWRGRRNA